MAHGLSCSVACGIFWDQGLNLSLLNWQANSLPLSHEGNLHLLLGFSGGASGKEPECQSRRCKRRGFDPSLVGKIPWRRAWQPTPVSLLGQFHGQRSLAGYSTWVRMSRTRLSTQLSTKYPGLHIPKCFPPCVLIRQFQRKMRRINAL